MKRISWQKEVTEPLRGKAEVPPQMSLVIYYQHGAEIVPLVPGARLLLGRAAEADISIPESTLSRQHARIELVGNDVWIEDLDSSNGTRVNDKEVHRCKLRHGDSVSLGTSVTLAMHATASYAQGLEHHSRFVINLEEEMIRSRTFGRQLAVLMAGPVSQGDQQKFSEWCPRIRQVLRPVDRVAQHSPAAVEILLPETGHAAALHLATRILESGQNLRCGVAIFPGAAESAETLLDVCHQALQRAVETDPIVAVEGLPPPRQAEVVPKPLVEGVAMRAVYETVERIAPSSLPVLIVGETGSGKEVVARAIHEAGPRRKRSMRCINCGAIPHTLVTSTLFGHERGAFTGASQRRKGVFEETDGGSLLLDEVGELPAEAQVALLRVIETGCLNRVGSSEEIPVDVRIISATHRNLEMMCEAGTFRWDLYYRLNTITLKVPPLRQRIDEIAPLAEHFAANASRCGGLPHKRIDADVLDMLKRYQWPGNVRELRNTMERAVLMSAQRSITIDNLPARVRSAVGASLLDQGTRVEMRPVDQSPSSDGLQVERSLFKSRVQSYETKLIRGALERTGWNKTAAAKLLRMPLRTLMNKVGALGLKQDSRPTNDTRPALLALSEEEQELDFKSCIQRYEAKLLLEALNETRWKRAEAARRLGLPLSTVLYKIKSYGLQKEG